MSIDRQLKSVQEATRADDTQDAGSAAAHLLELAARDVEQWRLEARTEADAVVGSARVEALQIIETCRVEADAVRRELAEERQEHERRVVQLQRLEDSYRERIRSHLTELLEAVDRPSTHRDD